MIRPRRAAPRRRLAPQWNAAEWQTANAYLHRRSGGRCECCGTPLRGRAERHHRIRRRDGGDRLANLLLLLPEHHEWWTRHPEDAREFGVIVSAFHPEVAHAPVLHLGRTWVTLTDDGEAIPYGGTLPSPLATPPWRA